MGSLHAPGVEDEGVSEPDCLALALGRLGLGADAAPSGSFLLEVEGAPAEKGEGTMRKPSG